VCGAATLYLPCRTQRCRCAWTLLLEVVAVAPQLASM
jgi:hypothetical protein